MFGVGVSSRVAACVVLNFQGSQDAWCLGMSWLLLSSSSCFVKKADKTAGSTLSNLSFKCAQMM